MAKSLPTPLIPPPTTLLMWRRSFADAKLRRKFESNLMFSRCRSRRVKFEAEICKFKFKFERKTIRRSIFVLDETLLNLATGVTM